MKEVIEQNTGKFLMVFFVVLDIIITQYILDISTIPIYSDMIQSIIIGYQLDRISFYRLIAVKSAILYMTFHALLESVMPPAGEPQHPESPPERGAVSDEH